MQVIFRIVVAVFTVASLASMGLKTDVREVLRTLRNVKTILRTIAVG